MKVTSLTGDADDARADAATRAGGTLRQLGTAARYALVTAFFLGFVYPLVMIAAAALAFPERADGSLVTVRGKVVGSAIIGQAWTEPQNFHGRPSAAGKNGYDPTATGGTNLGPSSKKLIDATRAALAALKEANPAATRPVPMDLVTTSASGIDPDISPEAAEYQVPRVAKARRVAPATVEAIVAAHVHGRQFGFLGEPHVNVLELNLALDRR